jgi:acylglycerol lipase
MVGAQSPGIGLLARRTAGSQDKTLKLYEGHYHDLLNDIGKEQVVADITGWIDKHS